MQKLISIILLGSVSFLSPHEAKAQSFYSQRGVGLTKYFVSGQAVGMGGVGLAVSDRFSFNYVNPAALVGMPAAFISGTFTHEALGLSGSGQNADISNTNFSGVQFHLPIKRDRISFAVGLIPYSKIEYSFSGSGSLNNTPLTETLSGAGGVNNAFLSLAFRPFDRLSIGVTGLLYFGNLRSIWRITFAETSGLLNTQQENTLSFTDSNFRVGAQFEALPGWRLGAVYSPSASLNADQSILLINILELTDLPGQVLKIPAAYGVGTSLFLGKKLLVGADYYVERWSDISTDGFVNDGKRFSIGLEYSGRSTRINSSLFSRSAIRLGFFVRDLGLEVPVGESVKEVFGTLGVGFPLRWSASRLDFGLEIGQRGSLDNNPIKENIVRITGAITVGEAWFFRGARR